MAEQTPDSIITTQRNGQTIVAELFFNHSSTETFRDKLLNWYLPTVRVYLRLTVKSRKKRKSCDNSRPDEELFAGRFLSENPHFPQVKSREKHRKNAPIA